MKIEIPLTQVQQFVNTNFHKKIALKNIAIDKIEVKYFVSMILTIKEVKEYEIVFQYKVNGFLNLLVKGAHFLLRNKLKDAPFEWLPKTCEIIINIRKIPALDSFMTMFYISELHFVNKSILLELNTPTEKATLNK